MSLSAPALPTAELSRRFRFSASHRLHVDHLSDTHNRDVFGKCNNPFGHGHNYIAQVTLAGPIAPDTGMVVNLADLDAFVTANLVERFNYANLNQDAAFLRQVPSTENLCVELWLAFEPFLGEHPGLVLRRIRIEETNNNAFDFFGQGQPVPSLE